MFFLKLAKYVAKSLQRYNNMQTVSSYNYKNKNIINYDNNHVA